MDSKVLSKEQLTQLVKFINSRSFREPVVVLEILDHFACKVEEILAAQPGIEFEEAMRKAHASFGVMGFQPIAASFAEQTRKKYKKLFWTNFRSVLSRPAAMLGLPAIGVLVFKLYVWASANLWFETWGTFNLVDAMFLALILVCPILDITTMLRLPKMDRRHPFVTASLMNGSVSGVTMYILLPSLSEEQNARHAWVVATILALYIVYIIPRHIATRQTIKKAKNDIDTVKRMSIV